MRRWIRRLGSLPYLLPGRSLFDAPDYRESVLTRLLNLFAQVDLERWRGGSILEVGAGLGYLGDAFRHLGFEVTSTDGRPEHVARMRARGARSLVLDLDRTGVDEIGEFDVVLAFGVLYHLSEPERFLAGCARAAPVLWLESAVCDHPGAVLRPVTEPGGRRGQDQALDRRGCRPSPRWVEEACRRAGFAAVRDVSTPLGNWRFGRFDWPAVGDGAWQLDGVNHRKMWLCETAPPAPAAPRGQGVPAS